VARFVSPIRLARQIQGLSLDRVAEAVHSHASHLSRVERGQAALRPDLADKLAKLYQVPRGAILVEKPAQPQRRSRR
jgi:transcriptional regulator with XRE-family HTH domain